MAEQSDFVTDVLRLLAPLGEVTAKPMFGGHGLFFEGRMFALIPRAEALFLKADEVNRPAFVDRGAKSHGRMPYYETPPETLRSWAEMKPWATGAVEAARRAKPK